METEKSDIVNSEVEKIHKKRKRKKLGECHQLIYHFVFFHFIFVHKIKSCLVAEFKSYFLLSLPLYVILISYDLKIVS